MNSAPFMKSSPEQRLAVLTRMAQNESKPEITGRAILQRPEGTSRLRVLHVGVGIKQEMEYKGNTYQTGVRWLRCVETVAASRKPRVDRARQAAQPWWSFLPARLRRPCDFSLHARS
jgi:hypothetical protein